MVEKYVIAKRGEPDYKNPWGGIAGDNRFSVSLKILMEQSGYRKQVAWAKDLGVPQRLLSEWIIGKNIPTKRQMEIILERASDEDHLRSDLVEAWEEQALKRGPRTHMVGAKIKGAAKTPVGKWVRAYSEKHSVSLKQLSSIFALRGSTMRVYDHLSVDSMSDIIHQSENVLGVDLNSLEDLCEAVALTVEYQVSVGKYKNEAPRYKRHRYGV